MNRTTRHPQYDIFLAHASDDGPIAEMLYDLLNPHLKVFLDSKTLILGDNWDVVLREAQRDSLITVVLISPSTNNAFYQREEIAAAIALTCDDPSIHRVIPVYLDNVPSDNVSYGLRTKHSIKLQGTTTLEAVAQQLRDTLARLQPSLENQHAQAADHALLHSYRDQLVKQVRNVDLFHLKHLVGNVPFPIDQIYVPLKVNPRELRTGTTGLSVLQDAELRYLPEQEKQPKPLGELLGRLFELSQYRCMLVLGKPGAGKTTLLKYLAFYFASARQQEIREIPSDFGERIPFYVRLKDIKDSVIGVQQTQDRHDALNNPSELPSLAKAILHNLKIHGYRPLPTEETLEAWLQEKGHNEALVLLDGLDEVADSAQRQQVADWLKRQVRDYQKAHFIISSRLHGYSSYYAPDESFTVEVDDFNQELRYEFLERWFCHVHCDRSVRQCAPRWQADAVARQLAETIEADDNLQLKDLAKNPLLLSMIAIIQLALLDDGNKVEVTIPSSRTLLYERCVELFIREWSWDWVRGVDIQAINEQNYRYMLEHVALFLQQQQLPLTRSFDPNLEARRATLGEYFAEQSLALSRQEDERYCEKQAIIAHLQKAIKLDETTLGHCLQHSHYRTLLLVEKTLNEWGFQHKTFQEYLAAEALIHALQAQSADVLPLEILFDHLGQDHWHVVFELLFEKLQSLHDRTLTDTVWRAIDQRMSDDAALAARAWYWIEGLYYNKASPFPKAERHRLQQHAWSLLAASGDPIALCRFHDFAALGLPALGLTSERYYERLKAVANNPLQFIHHVLLLPELIAEPDTALIEQLRSCLEVLRPNALSGAVALTLQRYGDAEQHALDRHLFVTIPAGEFYRGSLKSEDGAEDNEIDGQCYSLTEYSIARYPVTHAEYQRFVVATQLHDDSEHYLDYPECRGHYAVGDVTWYDANAYVDWLNQQQHRYTYALPTEAQWERAARGAAMVNGKENRRRYPWGNEFDARKGNVQDDGLKYMCAVGCFPEGASPDGVLDMVGAIDQWCSDGYEDDYYQRNTVDKNETETSSKVKRGGRNSRCAYRSSYSSDDELDHIGFRVARIRNP